MAAMIAHFLQDLIEEKSAGEPNFPYYPKTITEANSWLVFADVHRRAALPSIWVS